MEIDRTLKNKRASGKYETFASAIPSITRRRSQTHKRATDGCGIGPRTASNPDDVRDNTSRKNRREDV